MNKALRLLRESMKKFEESTPEERREALLELVDLQETERPGLHRVFFRSVERYWSDAHRELEILEKR